MLKKMVRNIFGVSFFLASAQLFAMLASVLLGRHLSESDFGEFGLMRTLILFIPPLAIWGQDIATARYFSKIDVTNFRWDRAFWKILSISSILLFVGVYVVHLIYQLDVYKLSGLYIATLFFCASLFFSSLFRSQQRYNQAILMYSGFRGLFFFFLLPIFILTNLTKHHAIYSYIGVIVVMGIFNFIYSFRTLKRGPKPVPYEMHKTGLLLMGIEASVDVMASLDVLFIPRMLGYDVLGLYAASIVPSRIFNILARAAKYVWVPEFGKSKNIPFKKIHLLTAIVSITLLVTVLLLAKPILHLLYNGKYDAGASILRVLALVGVVRFFYGLASSVIVGKMSIRAVRYHLWITIIAMILYIIIIYYFLLQFGAIGAAWALLVITVLRMFCAYGIIYIFNGTSD
jgi:O-antigen/teichoic acid export membrane protein